jgi:monoterpene epsilon-lactone hydrolase
LNRLPADVHCQHVSADGIAAEWIAAPNADSGVILCLHGDAYALDSINTYREFVVRPARAATMHGLAINYLLAPGHPFPAALDDAAAAYGWLLALGVDPSRIIVAGDSAGGGLALAALVALRDADKPLPAGAVCISPWTDLALPGASIQSKAQVDCMLDADSLEMYARLYAGERDRVSALISRLFADLSDLPPPADSGGNR